MARRLAALLLLFSLAGCILDPYRCDYETRNALYSGKLVGTVYAKPDSGTVELYIYQATTDPAPVLTISVASFFAGAIAGVEVTRADPKGKVLISVQGSSGGPGTWYSSGRLPVPGPGFEDLLFLSIQRRLELVVRVGPGNTGTLSGILKLESGTGWYRPTCGD